MVQSVVAESMLSQGLLSSSLPREAKHFVFPMSPLQMCTDVPAQWRKSWTWLPSLLRTLSCTASYNLTSLFRSALGATLLVRSLTSVSYVSAICQSQRLGLVPVYMPSTNVSSSLPAVTRTYFAWPSILLGLQEYDLLVEVHYPTRRYSAQYI